MNESHKYNGALHDRCQLDIANTVDVKKDPTGWPRMSEVLLRYDHQFIGSTIDMSWVLKLLSLRNSAGRGRTMVV